MDAKLTAAQKRAWELIKSQLAMPRQERSIFGGVAGKPGIYSLIERKRITRKTMIMLDNAGLIKITDMWMSRLYFHPTEAGRAEIPALVEMLPGGDLGMFPAAHPRPVESPEPEPFCPTTGDLFARPGNEGIWALVITPERPAYGGYLVYAVLIYPSGNLSAPQMVVLLPTDLHICRDWPLPVNGQLALKRRQQIQDRPYTLPAYTAACPLRTAAYDKCMQVARPKWTEAEFAAWEFATGWPMRRVDWNGKF